MKVKLYSYSIETPFFCPASPNLFKGMFLFWFCFILSSVRLYLVIDVQDCWNTTSVIQTKCATPEAFWIYFSSANVNIGTAPSFFFCDQKPASTSVAVVVVFLFPSPMMISQSLPSSAIPFIWNHLFLANPFNECPFWLQSNVWRISFCKPQMRHYVAPVSAYWPASKSDSFACTFLHGPTFLLSLLVPWLLN